jgi:hypothetical protein
MMRVLVVAQYFPPDMGGGATRAYNVARGLLKAGCRVTVVRLFRIIRMGMFQRALFSEFGCCKSTLLSVGKLRT